MWGVRAVYGQEYENSNDLTQETFGENILVAGGAGFLGSHLCELLISRGKNVYCLDNFHTGRPVNVEHLRRSNRITIVEHDIIREIPKSLPIFSEIYNLACPASPVHYQSNPVATAITNSHGAWNILQRAQRDNARVFHASTSEVYGDPDVHPQSEEYWGNVNPVGPRSCYDEGKRFAETLFMDFARQCDLTVRIVRIFNTYGPRMQPDDGRVVSNFIIQALLGNPLTIYGDGSQTRSFCFVSDLIRGFDLLMHSPLAIAGPVNIGNPTEIAVEELAELVIELTGSSSSIIRKPLPVDDPRRRRPDITKASALLGWRPEVHLEEGLRRTIDHFEAELGRIPSPPALASAAALSAAL
jgi:UDP-glucuronate decarboxylase